jgi:cytochrome c oxidase assembly factor CtaG
MAGEDRKGLAWRWMLVAPLGVIWAGGYYMGYGAAGADAATWRFWTADLNPLPWLAAFAVLRVYLARRDRYRAGGGDARSWSAGQVLSFVSGLLLALALWESPLNGFVGRSMTLYTVKLMGEFEFAAPLIVLGIPFSLVDSVRVKGPWWSILRVLHRPAVTAAALAVILVLWDMTDQMALGLHNALVFGLLPGVYLALGMVVWMQSLRALPAFPNLQNHLRKGMYVWAMEFAMMAMGTIWFWSAMKDMNPSTGTPLLWGMTRVADMHIAGAVMTGLSLPTMCLVSWHFWQWISGVVGVSESEEYGDYSRPTGRQEL